MASETLLCGTSAYRREFSHFLRTGQPISLLRKGAARDRSTSHYVWRTRGDWIVRPEHAANEGRIFAWNDPPPTGHPGIEWNCRCRAEPYVDGETEFAEILITSDLSSQGERWGNVDFVKHYFNGNGKPVDLREIGHLREVTEHYAYNLGVFSRLPRQIARFAREHPKNPFSCLIRNTYRFHTVQFSHGGSEVRAWVVGYSERISSMLELRAKIEFEFIDKFQDPLDGDGSIGKFDLPFSTPYSITGEWTGSLSASVRVDHGNSIYHQEWENGPEEINIFGRN